jgi:hypothetical protein
LAEKVDTGLEPASAPVRVTGAVRRTRRERDGVRVELVLELEDLAAQPAILGRERGHCVLELDDTRSEPAVVPGDLGSLAGPFPAWQTLCYGGLSRRRAWESMGTARVQSLAREILALSESERQELACEVLPVLLTTRAGLAEIDASLRDLSDDELRALVERARQRARDLSEHEVAAIIAEGLRAARAQGGS